MAGENIPKRVFPADIFAEDNDKWTWSLPSPNLKPINTTNYSILRKASKDELGSSNSSSSSEGEPAYPNDSSNSRKRSFRKRESSSPSEGNPAEDVSFSPGHSGTVSRERVLPSMYDDDARSASPSAYEKKDLPYASSFHKEFPFPSRSPEHSPLTFENKEGRSKTSDINKYDVSPARKPTGNSKVDVRRSGSQRSRSRSRRSISRSRRSISGGRRSISGGRRSRSRSRRSRSRSRKSRSRSRDRKLRRSRSRSRDKHGRSPIRERRSSRSKDRYAERDKRYRSRRSPSRDSRRRSRSKELRSRSRSKEVKRVTRSRSREPRRKSRSLSRDRRSRSRSVDRSYRKRYRSSSRDRYRRRRYSRSHSRSRDRSKGRSGGAMTPQMALQQTMAAMSAKAQALTGIALPKYYNPAAVNPLKYAEQVQKRKLLWQSTEKVEEQPKNTVWDKLTFAQDQDGKMTAKFRKLMGIKSEGAAPPPEEKESVLKKQEELFRDLDQQYEMARVTTHTQRGVGLGYSAQALYPPIQK